MDYHETPLHFECEGATLLGVLACPEAAPRVGVVVVVGGPQYRVGSHRQFVALSRALAAEGIACLRFDYRGMGDSEGDVISFEEIDPDVAAAVNALHRAVSGLHAVVLWGLCDGATASAFAAARLRVAGVVLFNPWVRNEYASAEATLRHYYARRLLQRSFWNKLGSGNVQFGKALRALLDTLRRFAHGRRKAALPEMRAALPVRMGEAVASYRGPTLIVLSGNDQTAAEFRLAARHPGALRDAMSRASTTCVEVPDADHTFSTDRWQGQAVAITLGWLRERFPVPAEPAS